MDPILIWTVVLLTVASAFWLARRFAMRLNWPQRKVMLYTLFFGAMLGSPAMGDPNMAAIVILALFALIASFFAVLLAPFKA